MKLRINLGKTKINLKSNLTCNISTQHITVRKLEELFTMSSELSCFLIASYCPSDCHAILLHQDSQIYDKMTSSSLKENIIDKN